MVEGGGVAKEGVREREREKKMKKRKKKKDYKEKYCTGKKRSLIKFFVKRKRDGENYGHVFVSLANVQSYYQRERERIFVRVLFEIKKV